MNGQKYSKKPLILLEDITSLRHDVYREGNELFQHWYKEIERDMFKPSAINLSFYLALRRRDIRDIQEALSDIGLSSLGRLESKTITNLDSVILNLYKITGKEMPKQHLYTDYPYRLGKWLLDRNTKRIFGKAPENRFSRIMVTLPTEAAYDEKYVYKLISKGMNVARINCAHDHQDIWLKMIYNIRKASSDLNQNCQIQMDIAGPKTRIDGLMTNLKNPKLERKDTFFISSSTHVQKREEMKFVCTCTTPEIISELKEGDPVMVDDGRIEGYVETVFNDGVVVRVKKIAGGKSIRLKAEKGLNFPYTPFTISGITEKDKIDLDFICKEADIIGFSFVRNAEDVKVLQKEIAKRVGEESAKHIPLMAKIETVQGVENLPEIIFAAASKNPLCVMIARGDLAVEAGYLRLAELQEEILWVCEAAHIPVIWATQVLESLNKTGIPSRGEITDAAMGGRAECVMLNKGEFLFDSVEALDDILYRMQSHQYKKSSRLRALNIARGELVFENNRSSKLNKELWT